MALAQAAAADAVTAHTTLVNDWLREKYPAASAWDVGGWVRAQVDVKSNAGISPDQAPDKDFIRNQSVDNTVFFLREKVHLGYQHEWFKAYVEARDSSTSGDSRNPNPFSDVFDLHQAYVTLRNPKEFPVSLKVGRQQMSYGDERWVEVAEWNNLERAFDAAKLRYESEKFWVDGFVSHYVMPDNGNFNQANWHDLFSGIYASSRKLVPGLETDLYFFSRNANPASATIANTSGAGVAARDVYTIGARLKSLPGQFKGWDFGTEIAGQVGSVNQGGVRLEHEALAANAMGGYTWTNAFGMPRVGLDYTYGSGDSNPTDNKHGTFDLLFGAAHKFYGIMDVTGIRNTHNPGVNFTLKPHKKLNLRLDYLAFWLADTHDLTYAEVGKGRTLNGYGIKPGNSSFFGSEIDFIANWAATSFLSLQAGYSHFFPGDYVKQSVASVPANGGAVAADYFYAMTTLKF